MQSITSIFLLKSMQIATLKTSLIGGILTLILLNNGVAFCYGGLRRYEQFYNTLAATCFNGLLSVSIASFVIPTASYYMSATAIAVITKQSRGMALVLILVYALYLLFELLTHKSAFEEPSQKVAKTRRKGALPEGAIVKAVAVTGALGGAVGRADIRERPDDDAVFRRTAYEDGENEPPE